MSDPQAPVRGPLDPVDRSMEALFGLIMVLTFTGSLSVYSAGRADVREMLIGAVGCNLAWGVIDACFYLMGVISERGRARILIGKLRTTSDGAAIEQVFAEALPDIVAEHMTTAERNTLRERIITRPHPDKRIFKWADLKGAFGVFLWVFLITFPVALPFLFIGELFTALRTSNAIAIVLLGVIGWRLARHAGFKPWATVLLMVVFGLLMVALTIALGG